MPGISSLTNQSRRVHHGLTYDGSILYRHGVPVTSVTLVEGLKDFKDWPAGFQNPVLVAHNCKNFDSLVLCKAILKHPNVSLQHSVEGFCDSLPLLKEMSNLKHANYCQATLMPSCATVDQVSRAHGLILGSGKSGLNRV